MKINHILLLLCLTLPTALFAGQYELKSDEVVKSHGAEAWVEAGVTFEPAKWLEIGVNESARFNFSGTIKSHTQAAFDFITCKYLTLGLDYTLLYTHKENKDLLKHRIGASAELIFHPGRWRIALRARPMLTMRFDSINTAEKNKYDWHLRSRLHVQYNIPGKPIKPYLSVEVENTLNAKSITGYVYNEDADMTTTYDFKGNYISMIRPAIGVKYTPAKNHHLNFFYKFSADFDRDYNITKKARKLEVSRERDFKHIIGVAYNFTVKPKY